MNRLLSFLVLSLALLPQLANATGYTGRLLKVYFGIEIPKNAPSVTIGYGDHPTNVEMQSVVFKFTKKLTPQEVVTEVNSMCRAYYRAVDLGRRSMPRVYDGMLFVSLTNYVDGESNGNIYFELISRDSDPFKDAAPFPKMSDCTSTLIPLVTKASDLF